MRIDWLSSRRKWGAASAGLLAAAMLAISVPAEAQTVGIRATRHNLGSDFPADVTEPAGRNKVTDTAEICVFCHTPHGSDTSAPVPLWNKRLGVDGKPTSGTGTFKTYAALNTPSLDGQIAQVGSVSMACLSCHDGTQAMDNVINAPGSGNYDATGGGVDGRSWTWSGSAVDPATGKMLGDPSTPKDGRIPMLGTDLSNDHPIGIEYCGGGLSAAAGDATPSGTCKDGDFIVPKVTTVNGNVIFYVDTGGTGKQRTDFPLYVAPRPAASGTGTVGGPLVECASCHDPHVSEGQAGPAGTGKVAGATFLRISNAGSAVCTSCHVK